MSRTSIGIALCVLLVVAAATIVIAPPDAGAASIAERLRDSRARLSRATDRLDATQAELAAALLTHQRRGTGVLVRAVAEARREVRARRAVVRALLEQRARQRDVAALARAGDWRSLIDRAAKKYGVSADGLYRLMMMESGGRPRAVGAGRYYGLFQYALGTWNGKWNPWRARSVFDGSAQIEASAYAVKKGMGRSLWGNTYPAAF